MPKFNRKIVFILVVVITITALLLPAPKLESRMAALDPAQPQSVQTVAGIFPGSFSQDNLQRTNSYTWAG
jgi:hypothetical protein